MDILKMFVSLMVFVFTALLFPTLKNEIDNATLSGGATPLVRVFPWVILAMSFLPAIYLIIKETR